MTFDKRRIKKGTKEHRFYEEVLEEKLDDGVEIISHSAKPFYIDDEESLRILTTDEFGTIEAHCKACGGVVGVGGQLSHHFPYDDLSNRCKDCLDKE